MGVVAGSTRWTDGTCWEELLQLFLSVDLRVGQLLAASYASSSVEVFSMPSHEEVSVAARAKETTRAHDSSSRQPLLFPSSHSSYTCLHSVHPLLTLLASIKTDFNILDSLSSPPLDHLSAHRKLQNSRA